MKAIFIAATLLFFAIIAFLLYCGKKERKPSSKTKNLWRGDDQGYGILGDLLQLVVWLFFC